jgi:hypothetical protein
MRWRYKLKPYDWVAEHRLVLRRNGNSLRYDGSRKLARRGQGAYHHAQRPRLLAFKDYYEAEGDLGAPIDWLVKILRPLDCTPYSVSTATDNEHHMAKLSQDYDRCWLSACRHPR